MQSTTLKNEHTMAISATFSPRLAGVLAGALFLIVSATFFASDAIMASLTTEPDYLSPLADSSTSVVLSSLLALMAGVGVVGIALLLHPILARHSLRLSLGYVSFRIAELAAITILALTSLMVLSLAEVSASTGIAGGPLDSVLLAARDWMLPIVYIFSCAAGLMLSAALYTSRLVPRWLSILGLVGYTALMLASILHMFGVLDMVNGTAWVGLVPGGLFEIILPLWLFIKGFNLLALNAGRTALEA